MNYIDLVKSLDRSLMYPTNGDTKEGALCKRLVRALFHDDSEKIWNSLLSDECMTLLRVATSVDNQYIRNKDPEKRLRSIALSFILWQFGDEKHALNDCLFHLASYISSEVEQ